LLLAPLFQYLQDSAYITVSIGEVWTL
jgi:hypothetical protein